MRAVTTVVTVERVNRTLADMRRCVNVLAKRAPRSAIVTERDKANGYGREVLASWTAYER